jgi:hypothetical protein
MRVLFVTQQIDYEPQGIMHLSSALKVAGHHPTVNWMVRAMLVDASASVAFAFADKLGSLWFPFPG